MSECRIDIAREDASHMATEPLAKGARPSVTLVIPGRNCADTLDCCIASVVPLKEAGVLTEIIFVDDGSSDNSAEIAKRFPVRVMRGRGVGAAAARNDGIAAASGEYVWCLDADCVAQQDALQLLLETCESERVAAAGGSLGNASHGSLLAKLIQDEIDWRHARMPVDVNFLASGNVVYRRSAMLEVGGFDESFRWAHDAELAYRFRTAGWQLRFCREAMALHHHFTRWWPYLTKQAAYARNRIRLYRRYPDLVGGDDYSSWVDHLQPPLALGLSLTAPLSFSFFVLQLFSAAVLTSLVLCCSVTTFRIYRDKPQNRVLVFLLLCVIRSLARALGACRGIISLPFETSAKTLRIEQEQAV